MLSAGEDSKVEGSTWFPCGGFKDIADEDASEGQKAMKCSEEFVHYFRAKPNQLHQRRACAPLEAGMKFSVGHGAEKEAGRGIMIAI